MQCHVCRFENMEGRQRCGRCGSILEWEGSRARHFFEPPRAGGSRLRRWLTAFGYRIKSLWPAAWRRKPRPATPAIAVTPKDSLLAAALAPWKWYSPRAAILSIVPGLGHLTGGRPAVAPWLTLAWCVLLWALFNAWVPYIGAAVLTLVCVFHGLAAGHAAGFFGPPPPKIPLARVAVWSQLAFMVCVAYWLLVLVVAPRIWAVSQLAEPVPLLASVPDDAWRGRRSVSEWRRGDWALFDLPSCGVGPAGGDIILRWNATVPAIVAGLPGDRVTANRDGLWINHAAVPPEWLPGDWTEMDGIRVMAGGAREPVRIPNTAVDRDLGDGEYFVVVQQPIEDPRAVVLRIREAGFAQEKRLSLAVKQFWPWTRRFAIPRGTWTPGTTEADAGTEKR